MKFSISHFWPLISIGAIGLGAGAWRVCNEYTPTSKAAREKLAVDNRKLDEAQSVGSEWLKRGTWLTNARPMQPSSADLQFSPDGALITGGRDEISTRKVLLWDAHTGKVKAKYGLYWYDKFYEECVRVNFLSNQKILWVGTHDIAIFDREGIIRDHITDTSTYNWLNTSPPTKTGLWIYSRGLYAQDKISAQTELDEKLRFLDFRSKKITRVLSKFLTGPIYYAGMKLNAGANLKTNGSQLAVLMQCGKIFVVGRNDKVIWNEAAGCLTDEGVNLTKKTIVDDFQLNSKDQLLLLDHDKGLRQINLKTGKEAKPYLLAERVTKLAASKSGKLWAFGDRSGRFLLVDAEKRELLANVILPFTSEHLTFSPDEKSIAVGGLVILPLSSFVSPANPK